MSFTYSGDPTTSNRDQLRFMLGDTDITDQLLQDEELNYLITQYGMAATTPLQDRAAMATVAAEACDSVAAKFARLALERMIGGTRGLRIQAANKYKQYLEMAAVYRSKMAMTIVVGGISQADKAVYEGDTDATQPAFSRGMFKQDIIDQPEPQESTNDDPGFADEV